MDIEIWSDIACPWCYVGKRRFETALAAFEHRDEVSVTWRSFELDPAAPAQRTVDSATHLAEKYGMSRDEALARQRSLAEVAAGDGLDMRSDLARGGNTFDAHRPPTAPAPRQGGTGRKSRGEGRGGGGGAAAGGGGGGGPGGRGRGVAAPRARG